MLALAREFVPVLMLSVAYSSAPGGSRAEVAALDPS
jgi:hypothetical protein